MTLHPLTFFLANDKTADCWLIEIFLAIKYLSVFCLLDTILCKISYDLVTNEELCSYAVYLSIFQGLSRFT